MTFRFCWMLDQLEKKKVDRWYIPSEIAAEQGFSYMRIIKVENRNQQIRDSKCIILCFLSLIFKRKLAPGAFKFIEVIFFSQASISITKTCLFKYTENFTTKKWNFSDKKFRYLFLFLLKAKIVGTRQDEAVLTSTHNLCFWAEIRKIRKNNVYPVNPSFTI